MPLVSQYMGGGQVSLLMTCRSVVPTLGKRPLPMVNGSSSLVTLVFFATPSVVLRDQTHNHHLCFHSN